MPNGIDAGVMDVGGAVPVPVSEIVVGLVAAFELTVMLAGSAPVTFGAKTRLSMHVAAGAKLIGPPANGAPPAAEPNPHQWAAFGAGPLVVSG